MASYLYNGVELPSLPEWDKEAYPYAVIVLKQSNMQYSILISDYPFNARNGNTLSSHNNGINYCVSGLTSNAWDAFSENNVCTAGKFLMGAVDFIWANYDVIYQDYGTITTDIHLEASEPTPTTNIDSKFLIMGWLVGRAIAGQRKKQTQVPEGVLISSDGYILTDCDGVYLIAMDEDADSVPEGALIASGGYILKDSNGRYLITRRMLDG